MRFNRTTIFFFFVLFIITERMIGQACNPINGNIDIYELENQPNHAFTRTGSTTGGENTFSIGNPPDGEDWLGYPANDHIYEFTIEPNDTFNLFFDLCPGTNYDATIGIVHAENITNCLDVDVDEIVMWDPNEINQEWRDANALCPVSDLGETGGTPGFVPIARDVYLTAGTYYIIVDGEPGAEGDYTLVVGEMLELWYYQVSGTNDYIDIYFNEPVYGLSDVTTWTLGWPIDNSEPPNNDLYWQIWNNTDVSSVILGTVILINGQNLLGPGVPPYPGYTSLRIPILSESSGAPVSEQDMYSLTIDYDTYNNNLVNFFGIPISVFQENLEFNALDPPVLDSLSNLTAANNQVRVHFNEGVYSSPDGTGPVANVHFVIETVGANLAPSIGIISQVGGELAAIGGETELEFNISMVNSTGVETIRIRAQENSVFNAGGIAMSTTWSPTISLNDLVPPNVSYAFSPEPTDAGVVPDAEIFIAFDNAIKFKGNTVITDSTVDDIISLNYIDNDGVVGSEIAFEATFNGGESESSDTITVTPNSSLIQTKEVLMTVTGDTVIDANSNEMVEKQLIFTVADIVLPDVDSIKFTSDNRYISLYFSENLWSDIGKTGDILPSDFDISIDTTSETSNASIVTIEQVTDIDGDNAQLDGIDAVRLYLSFNNVPPSGSESITIIPNENELFDQGNNALTYEGKTFELSDELSPTIVIKSISSSDETGFIHPDTSVIITSTEPLQLDDGTVISDDIIKNYITFNYNNGTAINDTIMVNANKTTIEIKPDASLIEWDQVSASIESETGGKKITDGAGNIIASSEVILRVDDITAPVINTATLEQTNTFITLTTSEPVYFGYNPDGGIGGLTTSHFDITIAANEENNVETVFIDNVKDSDGQPLQGGETTIIVEIVLNPSYASGSEVLTISPSDRPIYDRRGNIVSAFLNQKSVTLYDKLSPSFSFSPISDTLIVPTTDFEISFNEKVKRYNSETGTASDFDTSDVSSMVSVKYTNENNIDFSTSFNFDTTTITLSPKENLVESKNVEVAFGEVFSDILANSISSGFAQYIVNDVSPPIIQNDTIGSGNKFVQIHMSEPVYSDSIASASLTQEDFNLVKNYGDLNGAESISIDYLSDESGGQLSGGDEIILVYLKILGSPNGTEKIMIKAASGQIFDRFGNTMSANQSTEEYTLKAAPIFNSGSTLSINNDFINLYFDRGPVFTNALHNAPINEQDFIGKLTRSDNSTSFITISSILNADGSSLDANGSDTVKLYFSLGFIPDGSEIINFYPESSSSIYNSDAVSMDTSEVVIFTLYDQLIPTYNINISDGDINIENNDTIIVSFSEPIRFFGGDPLTDEIAKENFIIIDTTNNITLENYFTKVNAPSPDSVWVIMTQPFGSEHVISFTIKNKFEDFSSNQVVSDSTILFTTRDYIGPGFISGSAIIDIDEISTVKNDPSEGSRKICFVDAVINDNVYSDSLALTSVTSGDFSVGVIQNEGSVSSAFVDNIFLPTIFVNGRQEIRFEIQLNEVPGGEEYIYIYPSDNNSIFDNGFNIMSVDSTSDTLSLYDLRFPTIDTTSIEHDGYIDLYSDTTIKIYFSEPIVKSSFDYSFIAKRDTIDFIHDTSLFSDSLIILLNTPVLSFDTLDLTIIHLEDTSGNIKESLIERRFFTKAAGDFSSPPDDIVGIEDLAIFQNGWQSADYTKELGPFTGTAPNLRVTPDSIFGIDDGMAFTQMWLWSLQTFGISPVMQGIVTNNPADLKVMENSFSIIPPEDAMAGQIIVEYNYMNNKIDTDDNSQFHNKGIFLTKNNNEDGVLLVEYALLEKSEVGIVFNIDKIVENNPEVNLSYSFFNDNFHPISQGNEVINTLVIPSEFSMSQNYPNPFNPNTTINFKLPINTFVNLSVYNLNGKKVHQIVKRFLNAGSYNFQWQGKDINGVELSSGIYLYKIEASDFVKTQKMIFVK